jgi:cation transport ATPase
VIALVTTTLNLVYEVLGPEPAAPERSQRAAPRVIAYFAWLVLLLALIALIGFIPAIGVFIFSYMRWGFRESWIGSLGYAAATSLVCWLVFDLALHAAWPRSWLGDLLPNLSAGSGLI